MNNWQPNANTSWGMSHTWGGPAAGMPMYNNMNNGQSPLQNMMFGRLSYYATVSYYSQLLIIYLCFIFI